ncbi:unnamed protein product, partial [Notodromas monacha]
MHESSESLPLVIPIQETPCGEESNQSLVDKNLTKSRDLENESLRNVSSSVEQEATKSQELEDESIRNESSSVEQEATQSQELENESIRNESSSVEQEATQSQELENESIRNESSSVEQEATQSQELENESIRNESSSVEQEATQSQGNGSKESISSRVELIHIKNLVALCKNPRQCLVKLEMLWGGQRTHSESEDRCLTFFSTPVDSRNKKQKLIVMEIKKQIEARFESVQAQIYHSPYLKPWEKDSHRQDAFQRMTEEINRVSNRHDEFRFFLSDKMSNKIVSLVLDFHGGYELDEVSQFYYAAVTYRLSKLKIKNSCRTLSMDPDTFTISRQCSRPKVSVICAKARATVDELPAVLTPPTCSEISLAQRVNQYQSHHESSCHALIVFILVQYSSDDQKTCVCYAVDCCVSHAVPRVPAQDKRATHASAFLNRYFVGVARVAVAPGGTGVGKQRRVADPGLVSCLATV